MHLIHFLGCETQTIRLFVTELKFNSKKKTCYVMYLLCILFFLIYFILFYVLCILLPTYDSLSFFWIWDELFAFLVINIIFIWKDVMNLIYVEVLTVIHMKKYVSINQINKKKKELLQLHISTHPGYVLPSTIEHCVQMNTLFL